MEAPGVPESKQYEEWRLAFDIPPGGPKASALADDLRKRLPPRIDVHRTGRAGIRVYAGTRADIDHALKLIGERLAAYGTQTAILLSRWNPGDERWQSPSLPIELAPTPLPEPWADVGEMGWEVRLRFEHDWEAGRLLDELREKGAAVIGRGNRCLVALSDEATARQRAAELRLSAPTAEIEVRPLSGFRRWMIHQKLYGNYAGSYDAHDGGAGSGV